jgi:hypothetical protein
MFVQSNLGIVTKMGLWLMPEPQGTLSARVNLPEPDDIGWWSSRVALFGYAEAVAAHARVVRRALEPHLGQELQFDAWHRGEPPEKSAAPRPSVLALQIVNWFGGRGGHIGFSPVLPPDGRLALEQFHRMKARFEQFGLDYYTSFTLGQRHINNVNLILYNRDDAAMVANARAVPHAGGRRPRARLRRVPHAPRFHAGGRRQLRFQRPRAWQAECARQGSARSERHLAARLSEVDLA